MTIAAIFDFLRSLALASTNSTPRVEISGVLGNWALTAEIGDSARLSASEEATLSEFMNALPNEERTNFKLGIVSMNDRAALRFLHTLISFPTQTQRLAYAASTIGVKAYA